LLADSSATKREKKMIKNVLEAGHDSNLKSQIKIFLRHRQQACSIVNLLNTKMPTISPNRKAGIRTSPA